jgi:hypothetical protein
MEYWLRCYRHQADIVLGEEDYGAAFLKPEQKSHIALLFIRLTPLKQVNLHTRPACGNTRGLA